MHIRSKIVCLLTLSLTVGCWAKTVMLDDFEVEGVDLITGDQLHPATTLNLSTDAPYSGKGCAVIHYRFAAPSGMETVKLLVAPNRINAPLTAIRLAVRGDGSPNHLLARFADAHNEVFLYDLGPVQSIEWTEVAADITKPTTIFGGDKNRTMDYPIRLQSIVLEERSRNTVGEIAVDAVRLEVEGNDETAVDIPECVKDEATGYDSASAPGEYDPATATFLMHNPKGRFVAQLTGDNLQPETAIMAANDQKLLEGNSLLVHYRFLPHLHQSVRIMGPTFFVPQHVHRFWLLAKSDREDAKFALKVRVEDAKHEFFEFNVGTIQGTEVQKLCADLDEPFDACWLGDGDRVMEYPILYSEYCFEPIGIDNDPIEGNIIFDDVSLFEEKSLF